MQKLIWLVIAGGSALVSINAAAITTDQPRKFDEYADICCEDEKARLDNFAIELQNSPEAMGYIIFYGGRRYSSCWYDYPRHRARMPYKAEAKERAVIVKPYLVNQRGVAPERIKVVNGGHRQSLMIELWIIPKGAKVPAPTPTLKPEDIKYRRGKLRDRAFLERCNEG